MIFVAGNLKGRGYVSKWVLLKMQAENWIAKESKVVQEPQVVSLSPSYLFNSFLIIFLRIKKNKLNFVEPLTNKQLKYHISQILSQYLSIPSLRGINRSQTRLHISAGKLHNLLMSSLEFWERISLAQECVYLQYLKTGII